MVRFDAVTFAYGKRPLFEGLDLVLEAGSTVGLLGLNGAGKTSLLKLGAGALFPASGLVEIFGRKPGSRSAAVLADIAFVPEDPWGPSLSPETWISRYGAFRPAMDRELFRSLLSEFAVDPTKSVAKMSYGQRKKFAVAAALASGARAVFLDEPTNGLDIPSKAQFRRALAAASSPDRVIVVSTHQARDLENLLDPVVILHGGRILCSFPASDLSDRLSVERLSSLEGQPVIYAEPDALGWTALLAKPGAGSDLELAFTAAVSRPEALRAALEGQDPGPFNPDAGAQK
ncbi:MAG: ABC transporter ATP-binding protein [Treponema sp.]|nr:ABC transporter ATP-binding protein [Treponema sp.]